ncbi:MAG: GNAT family N-acetyltransferase [Lachnospiraceae bacterium]|nr:GNAT family N-acetyltransferase [Lachnospiraceae bacterium]
MAVYYEVNDILIRDMRQSDAQQITDEEIAQGWNASVEKYEMRMRDQTEGKAVALVAEYKGSIAGYVNIYPNSGWGAFAGQGYPEIVDFGVLEKYRRLGIGSRLMDIAEQIASAYSDTVYLGVGMHSGYGSAQRMYVKRGYIPDGTGVWYHDKICGQNEECCNDDELVLYLSKKLQ